MPDFKTTLKRRLADKRIDPTLHLAVIDELAQHLDDRYRALVSQGMNTAEAERATLQELDDESLERELARAERLRILPPPPLGNPPDRAGLLSHWGQDVRYAARSLMKNRGFTAVAVITLALGVGATTAIFSVVNTVMVRPLPFADPGRLVRLWESNPTGGWPQFSHSHPNFLDWRAQQTTLEGMAAYAGASFATSSDGGAEIVRGMAVTADFLPLLGAQPALGRNFTAEEDRPGAPLVVLLGDGYWRRRFAGSNTVLGQTVALNGRTFSIIGVLPASFQWGTTNLEVMVPLAPDPQRNRGDHRISAIGRLKPGISTERALADFVGITAGLAERFPDSNRNWTARLATYYDWMVPRETRESLLVLLGAVALVLLIACGNVANLLLARGAVRQRELSVRIALGAARWRIFRQLLTESLLLAMVAGAVGLLVGVATTRLLVAFGPDSVPRLDEVSFDRNVLAFAIAISLLSALIFGLIPALQVSRQRPADTLRDATRGASGGVGRQHLRSALTIAEVALSVALLIGAGLLLRSFAQLRQVAPGFTIDGVMTLRINLPGTSYPTMDHRVAFYDRLLADVRAQPGMAGAATSSAVPLSGDNTSTTLVLQHRQPAPGEELSADWRLVSPGYFETMGIALRGRDFTPADRLNTLRVAIISESLAQLYFPGEDPLGKTVGIGSFGPDRHTIIGVAGNVRSFGLDDEPAPMVYGSAVAYAGWNPMYLVWRTAATSPQGPATPAQQVPGIRDAVRRIDPGVPIYDVRSLSEMLSDSFGPRRFNMYLLGVFASVALALAAIGLFGVMAYLVAQRTREIGVRLALGAERRDIFRLVLGRGVVLAVIGAVIGVGGALWLSRVMQSLLFSVSATDPATFAAVPILLIVVAVVACYVPARRAMSVDPVTALRAE
jgi:putative ABC transport system permease protein